MSDLPDIDVSSLALVPLSVQQTDFELLSHRHENCEATLVSDDSEDQPVDFIDDDEDEEDVSHFVGDNVDFMSKDMETGELRPADYNRALIDKTIVRDAKKCFCDVKAKYSSRFKNLCSSKRDVALANKRKTLTVHE